MKIKLSSNNININIELFDTPTAKKIMEALPIKAIANRWGDEIYFSVPVESQLEENAKEVLEIGDVCFWVSGRSIAIFFGKTPASKKDEPRAIEPVNIVGKVIGDVNVLKNINSGDTIRLEKI